MDDLNPHIKRKRREKFPIINQKIMRYIRLREEQFGQLSIGSCWLGVRARALALKTKLMEQGHSEYATFSASGGWFYRFRKRYNVSSQKRLYGEASSVDSKETEERMKSFRTYLEPYDPELIYNADETGLCHASILNALYMTGSTDLVKSGVKRAGAKNRVTLMICTNATGSHKVPPMMIGKSRSPACFKLVKARNLPVPYIHQSSAWMDHQTAMYWFN